MSSKELIAIKELRHFFKTEIGTKLESIDSNLELIAQKLCFPKATLQEILNLETIDEETKQKIKRIP